MYVSESFLTLVLHMSNGAQFLILSSQFACFFKGLHGHTYIPSVTTTEFGPKIAIGIAVGYLLF